MSEKPPGPSHGGDTAALGETPRRVTDALHRFLIDSEQLVGFIGFVTSLATRADEVVRIARRALSKAEGEPTPDDEEEPGSAILALRSYRQLILQMMLCRGVDNFLAFISELLALIFRNKPETLRSKETVPLDVALQYKTMEELVEHLADRRVHRLSYQGMRDLSDYLDSELGFRLFAESSDLEAAILLNEFRNLITHNRSIVNALFLNRVKQSKFGVGQFLELEVDEVFDSLDFLARQARKIDEVAIQIFDLPTRSEDELPLSDAKP